MADLWSAAQEPADDRRQRSNPHIFDNRPDPQGKIWIDYHHRQRAMTKVIKKTKPRLM